MAPTAEFNHFCHDDSDTHSIPVAGQSNVGMTVNVSVFATRVTITAFRVSSYDASPQRTNDLVLIRCCRLFFFMGDGDMVLATLNH